MSHFDMNILMVFKKKKGLKVSLLPQVNHTCVFFSWRCAILMPHTHTLQIKFGNINIHPLPVGNWRPHKDKENVPWHANNTHRERLVEQPQDNQGSGWTQLFSNQHTDPGHSHCWSKDVIDAKQMTRSMLTHPLHAGIRIRNTIIICSGKHLLQSNCLFPFHGITARL